MAFISFQLKISTYFRKLSTKKKFIAFNSFFFFFSFSFCIYSKYHFNFLCVKIMDKWYGMRSQVIVDIMHWNCLAWQQSISSGHPFFHPKPRNCPHQIDTFPARNNPSNACLRVSTSIAECKSGLATERNPVPVDTPPDEMTSSPLHIGKPVTSSHCLTF